MGNNYLASTRQLVSLDELLPKCLDALANGYRVYRSESYVAVEIMRADGPEAKKTVEILQDLSKREPKDADFRHILQLKDCFDLVGPNGTHKVLVYPPYGRNIAQFMEDSYDVEDRDKTDQDIEASHLNFSKELARQILEALKFIHSKGITHGSKTST
jgi:serine/threonine protein kinase